MPTSSEFKGIDNIGEDTYSDILRANIVSFVDWGLLNKGAFYNINRPNSGIYGGTGRHILQTTQDPRYTNGQIWQSFKGNWVWESGLTTPAQPIKVSGVYVNNTFYPSNTTGTYSHYVDYPRGRIIFNNPIATSSNVQAEYSYKWVNVTDARDYKFLRTLQYDTNRTDNSHFNQTGSGDYDQVYDSRLPLPLITVEVGERTTYAPYQLGGGSYVFKTVKLCIYSENDRIHSKLADILSAQKEKTIFLYDTNAISRARRFPLDSRGSINSGALTYPQIVAYSGQGGFMLQHNCTGTVRFKDSEAANGEWLTQDVYYSIVKYQTESVLTNI
jgi:hypothetical protein